MANEEEEGRCFAFIALPLIGAERGAGAPKGREDQSGYRLEVGERKKLSKTRWWQGGFRGGAKPATANQDKEFCNIRINNSKKKKENITTKLCGMEVNLFFACL